MQNNFCLKCHDGDGATATALDGSGPKPFSTSNTVLNVFAQFSTANDFYHPVRGAQANNYCVSNSINGNFYTMEPPWNRDSSSDHDLITCFDCHTTNTHGSTNQRMLIVNIDFDTMMVTNTPVLSTMGTPIATFCTTCHKASVYVDASKPETVGSGFSEHPGGLSNHGSPNNKLMCMGCHSAPGDFGGLASNESNGAEPGKIHGGTFIWGTESYATGSNAVHFIQGGYVSGSYADGDNSGDCGGGTCSHAGGKAY